MLRTFEKKDKLPGTTKPYFYMDELALYRVYPTGVYNEGTEHSCAQTMDHKGGWVTICEEDWKILRERIKQEIKQKRKENNTMPTAMIRLIKQRITNHLEEKGFKSDTWTRDLLAAALMTAYQEGFGAGLRKVLDSMEEVARSTGKEFKPLFNNGQPIGATAADLASSQPQPRRVEHP
jgi:hypothetical protein